MDQVYLKSWEIEKPSAVRGDFLHPLILCA